MEYYTKMERRHLRGVSGGVLDALARGLQLARPSATTCSNLARAAGPMPRTGRRPAARRVRPSVQRIIDAMTGAPVNELGRMDAVIHNAGVYTGPHMLRVNIVAPYRPQRLVYLSSSEHRSGRASPTRIDWSGTTGRYPDSKLRLGHLTQEWLATSDDPDARSSGGYWRHQRRVEPHPAVHDRRFQDQPLEDLARFTSPRLT